MLPTLRNQFRASPLGALDEFRREMDRWFGDTTAGRLDYGMPAEIVDDGEQLRIDIELPGVRLDDIDLTVEDRVLTVEGEKKMEREEGEKDSDFRLYERRYGRFERSFVLPRHVDTEKVDARLENGVLTVTLPKVETAKPKKIAISGEGRRITSGEAS